MNYKIVVTETYFKKLTKFMKKHREVVSKYGKIIEILEINPNHPSLRVHKLQGKLGEYFSISIDMKYRIIIDFIIRDNEIIPIDIGSHDEVY